MCWQVSRTTEKHQRISKVSNKIVGIFGISYCGSSMLLHMLARNKDVFPVGESHHLFEDFGRDVCSIHGKDCPFWTEDMVGDVVDSESLHPMMDAAKKLYKTNTFVFTDKNVQFYNGMKKYGLDVGFAMIMIKRPEQFVGSRFRRCEYVNVETHVEDSLKKYVKGYESIIDYIGKNKLKHIVVRYDRLVANPSIELARICEYLGIRYCNDMVKYSVSDKKTHAIGGNSTFYSSAFGKNSQWVACREKPWVGGDHRNWYSATRKAIVLNDRKWAKELSSEEVRLIRASEATRLYNKIVRGG